METRVAVIALLLENRESVGQMNALLSQYGDYIIGRMGIPYRAKGVHIISVALDAPQEIISALSGQLGALKGITVKTAYTKG